MQDDIGHEPQQSTREILMLTSFQTFKSSILGTRALRRMAGTLLASALVAGSAHAAVLWDQPLGVPPGGVNNAFLSQQFTDFTDLSTYVADDFSNAAAWSISRIFVPGDMWNLTAGTDLSGAVSLNFMIFANSGGQPAGFPGGVVAPQWAGASRPRTRRSRSASARPASCPTSPWT